MAKPPTSVIGVIGLGATGFLFTNQLKQLPNTSIKLFGKSKKFGTI